MTELKNHELVERLEFRNIRYENRPVKGRDGKEVEGLHQTWIMLDNEKQLNSYTTDAVKEVILAFQRASMDRSVVAAVFTATGDRSFCTGGNTKEYAEYYSGRPPENLRLPHPSSDTERSKPSALLQMSIQPGPGKRDSVVRRAW